MSDTSRTTGFRREPGQGSQTALRARNLELIRQLLLSKGGITQIEIAHHTGLSPATVSNLVTLLEHSHEVTCSTTTRSGRKAKLVSLANPHPLHLPRTAAG